MVPLMIGKTLLGERLSGALFCTPAGARTLRLVHLGNFERRIIDGTQHLVLEHPFGRFGSACYAHLLGGFTQDASLNTLQTLRRHVPSLGNKPALASCAQTVKLLRLRSVGVSPCNRSKVAHTNAYNGRRHLRSRSDVL